MGNKIVIALMLIATSASAQITYPIVDTGQELFYNNSRQIKTPKMGEPFYGQDAQTLRNAPSYTDNGDGTITDNVTGLMWQKGFEVMSYYEAMEECKECDFAGYTDWRVPTIKEAYSLILFSGVDASSNAMESTPEGSEPFIATDYFDFKYGANGSRPIDTQLLSSTLYVGQTGRANLLFGVNLADGRIKGYGVMMRGVAKEYTVRYVRGEAYGINDFVDNGDGTISDNATGLMWQQKDSGRGLEWQEALQYAQDMNSINYLGYSTWRVPNAKELQSIVDYSRSPESSSSAAIDPLFFVTEIVNEGGESDYPFFWSSTTHLLANPRNSAGAAAYLSFGRALGNMPQVGQGGSQSQQRGSRAQSQQRSGYQWINIHGAGAQRSDPKSGDPSRYINGRGPQGDAVRIDNYVRLVRDMD